MAALGVSVRKRSLDDDHVAVLFPMERLTHEYPRKLPPFESELVELLLEVVASKLLLVASHEATGQDDGLVVPFHGSDPKGRLAGPASGRDVGRNDSLGLPAHASGKSGYAAAA